MVVIGIDAHKRSHTAVIVDPTVGNSRRRPADPRARTASRCCAGPVIGADGVGLIEDCRNTTRRLEQDLLAAGERIVRVPPKLMSHAHDAARTYGKSDPIDALTVARAALRDDGLPAACLDGPDRELTMSTRTRLSSMGSHIVAECLS